MEQSPTSEAKWFSASQEIPRIFGIRMFITTFTSARHLSLPCARSNHLIPLPSPFLKIHLYIILLSTPAILSGLLPSVGRVAQSV
jgi:hypothetical protein